MRTSTNPRTISEPFTRVVRPSGSVPIVGPILCRFPTAVWVHRWRKRTVPCDGDPCLLCRAKLPTETRIFLPLLVWKAREVQLLDLPFSHWSTIKTYEDKNNGLYNLVLMAARMKPQDNAAIVLHARPLRDDERSHGQEIDPIPLVVAITAKNKEMAIQTMLAADMAASGSTENDDR